MIIINQIPTGPKPDTISPLQALTPGSAADGCWQPAFTAESMLQLVLTNMIDCEVDTTLTASGGTAATGPLRIDMRANPLQVQFVFGKTIHDHL